MSRRFVCVGGPLHGEVRDLPEGDKLAVALPRRWDEDSEFQQTLYYLRKVGNAKRSMRVLSRQGAADISPWELIDALAIAYGPLIGVEAVSS